MNKKIFIIGLLLLMISYSGIKIFAIDNLIFQPNLNGSIENDHIPPQQKNDPSNNPIIGPIKRTKAGKAIITQPTSKLVLVNKNRALPADFRPTNLTIPNIPFPFEENVPKKQVRPIVAQALEKLFTQAKQENIKLAGISGYRSYQRQKNIFNYNVRRKGKKEANKTSAQPGESEHQTGLAIDVSSPKINYQLIEKFGETKAGKWLANNASKYGFIIRYPKAKKRITGYQYEPWHLRYVGRKHALKISSNNLTLEQYLQQG
ncbi:D-alanyl-D-alanine carboxypeptidase [Halobacteroides halobius DSM 5150]|uniref:D-alanyl-D-alanine carboxypeptidase n=1 Tax=Halobacteroides halobius (strain ATCC 35273 / DSM 5150 / MD-1) TaxID=748449 RepID=L0K845_HALHC|nr:M15 family metallopeptidase [Halobacteroides halobius]AGB41447.1 D-alanyl-D-alanine carboxypeptidase [Halobacteroides halobius DSM 5150]